jgi:hypothetical protein
VAICVPFSLVLDDLIHTFLDCDKKMSGAAQNG